MGIKMPSEKSSQFVEAVQTILALAFVQIDPSFVASQPLPCEVARAKSKVG
jgi:uncharacterized membrane protein